MPKLHVAALGSSFAAGPGIPPLVDSAAMRSGQNYPSILAKALDADLTDLSVSGATLLNILTEPQTASFSRKEFAPQISLLPKDADIVTVTAGGNDVNYIGGMIGDAWEGTAVGAIASTITRFLWPVVSYIRSYIWSSPPAAASTPLTPEQLADRLGEVLDAVHAKAPNAKVYLVEYLALVGPATKPGVDISLTQHKIDHYINVAATLQHAYAVAADSRTEWCVRVPVHELSKSHVLGTVEPWVGGFDFTTLRRRGPILHPNLAGMKAVAEFISAKVITSKP